MDEPPIDRTDELMRLKDFLDAFPGGVVLTSAGGTIMVLNAEAQAMFGYTDGELAGTSITRLLSGRMAEAYGQCLPSDDGTARVLDIPDATGVRRDGTEFPIELSVRSRVSERGQILRHVFRDLTEQRRLEQELRASQERYQNLFDQANDVVYTHDFTGTFTSVNAAATRIYGYEPEELSSLNISAIVDPEYLALARENIVKKLQGAERTDPYVLLTHAKDGRAIWVEVSTNVLRTDGVPSGVQGIARDISERIYSAQALQRAEQAARESEQQLRNFVRNAPVVLFALDADGVVTFVDGSGLERIGITPGELIGRAVLDVHADAGIAAALVRAYAGEAFTTTMHVGELAFETRFMPLRGEDDAVDGVVGVATDVSDRERALKAVQASEERYRQIFKNSAIKLIVDPETGEIVDANPAASEFYGWSIEQLTSMTAFDLNTLPREHVLAEMAKAASEKRSYFQFSHRVASGEVRDIEIFAGPVEVNGRTLLCSIINDITDRKRAESLVAAQRRLLEQIARGEPLGLVLESLARNIEERCAGVCTVMLADESAGELRLAAAPSLPAAAREAAAVVPIGPSAGSCGTACWRKELVIVSDIDTDPLWEQYRPLAQAHGLRSCWSMPILSPGGVVHGAFAIYGSEPGVPRDHELELLEVAARIAAVAIERAQAEAAALARTQELEELYAALMRANRELAESKQRLEEKSIQLEQALESERERARRDPLTGTLNHAGVTDFVRGAIVASPHRPLAMAMVDVDGLKSANDTYGHQVGDAVLVAVARAMLRDGAIVGRYGGDEFVAVLPGADRPTAERYRDAVLGDIAAVALTDEASGAAVPVVASMGLAVFPEEAQSVADLIRLSDSAMYASRRARPTNGDSQALTRSLGGDLAARMVGEMVPLLTSQWELDDKLRLVAHRLSIGAGYDAVNFALFGREPGDEVTSNSFARLPDEIVQMWDDELRAGDAARDVRTLLERTRRPIILSDPQHDEMFSPVQRRVFSDAGLLAALIAPMIWQGQVVGALSVASRKAGAFGPRDAQFLAAVATQVTAIVRTAAMVDDLQSASTRLLQSHQETVMMLASAAEAHDHTTGRHLSRVREITTALALELGLDDERAAEMGLAATLHDIGKIRVPEYVLNSSSSLSDDEWALMKQHTEWGADFLAERGGFELAAQVALSHHERWDGSGYPRGLAGEAIPFAAQITAVADGIDAMTNDRPYRAGRPIADAVAEVQAYSGRQFSPRVVEALVRLFERGALPNGHHDDEALAA